MNTGSGWEKRVLSALVLLVVIAYAARWVYDLLASLVPVIFTAAGVLVGVLVVLAVLRRRRW